MISSVSNQGAYASSMMRGGMQRSAPPDPAELFSKTDANGDGTIDKVELSDALAAKSETEGAGNGPDADELFSMLDADGDGSITEEEHTQGLENLGAQGGPQGMNGPPPPGQESEEDEEDLFAATDADGSGTIELEELSSMLSSLSESEDSQDTSQVEELFSMLDADGDGSITEEEHTQGLENLSAQGGPQGMNGPPPPPPGQESEEDEEDLFATADTDGNGTIDLEELSSMLSGLSGSEDSQETSQVEELFSMLDADGDGAVTSEEHSQGLEEMAADREEKRETMQGGSALIDAAIQGYRFAAMNYDSFGSSQLSTSA